jgi:predicted ATPase
VETEPDPLAVREGRIIVPGSSRQLAVYGLFPPPVTQERTVPAGTRAFAVKVYEPELLWVRFDELCAPGASGEDFSLLPPGPDVWVIDGVPSPEPSDSGHRADAWEHFAAVLAVLARRNVTLFVVGTRPMDWAAASEQADDARLQSAFADIGRLLAKLKRIESDEPVPLEGVSGS